MLVVLLVLGVVLVIGGIGYYVKRCMDDIEISLDEFEDEEF